MCTLVDSEVEPAKRQLAIAQRVMDQGDGVRGDVPGGAQLVEPRKRGARLLETVR